MIRVRLPPGPHAYAVVREVIDLDGHFHTETRRFDERADAVKRFWRAHDQVEIAIWGRPHIDHVVLAARLYVMTAARSHEPDALGNTDISALVLHSGNIRAFDTRDFERPLPPQPKPI
jgi:hypothetical protein